jgi:gamma-glutamylputrescine oxidase
VAIEPESYWLQSAPAFCAAPAELPREAGIVVLGGGIMGCSLAYWLARHGLRPVLLERNTRPGAGATGHNGGLHVGGPNRDYADEIAAHGRRGAGEILRATALNRLLLEDVLQREAIDARYRRTGFASLAANEGEAARLQAGAVLQQADGRAAEWLNRQAAEDCMGTRLGEHFLGAMFTPDDGVIHSARYTLGMAEAAQRHGAQLVFGTDITGFQPGPGGRGWRVETRRGSLVAQQAAVTLNAWAPLLLPDLARVLTPVRGHIVVSPPVAASVRPWGANQGYEYGRQLDEGQLLIGGLRNARPDLDVGYAPTAGRNALEVVPELVAALGQHLGRVFPNFAGLAIHRHWAGVMDFSPDLNPLAGAWPGRPGLWLLVGLSGHGMPYSQVLPAGLAAQMAGGNGASIPRAFEPDRLLE